MKSYRLAYTDSLLTAFRPRGAEARWNSEGTVLVYSSEHPALAVLEILAGWEMYASLSGYHLYRCNFDESLVQHATQRIDLHDKAATRNIGDAWIRQQESVVLKVPSVVIPESYNYLLNPNHPEFLRCVELELLGPFSLDERLGKLVKKAKRTSQR